MERRVLIVLPEIDVGGGQKMAVQIAGHIRDERVKLRVLSLYPCRHTMIDAQAEKYGLDVRYLSKKAGADAGIIPEIYRAIRDFQPHVIHAHLRVMPYLLLPMVLNKTPLRYYTVHNLAQMDAAGTRRLILKNAFRHFGVIPVAISPLCKKSITEIYGIAPEFVPCISVGIDIKRFSRPAPYASLSRDTIQFIAVGRLMAQKNYAMMLEAFSVLHEKHPNTELVIFGEGELRGELEKKIRELRLTDSAHLPGVTGMVNQELWRSHVYLLSSDYEGLPQSILEAMAAGLPIVTTKAGGVMDVVEPEGNCISVDVGDKDGLVRAMVRLTADENLRADYSNRSAELAKQYSIETCAEEYLKLYLDVHAG